MRGELGFRVRGPGVGSVALSVLLAIGCKRSATEVQREAPASSSRSAIVDAGSSTTDAGAASDAGAVLTSCPSNRTVKVDLEVWRKALETATSLARRNAVLAELGLCSR